MAKGSKPTHRASVNTGTTDHPFWVTVGAAWAHEDGKGVSLSLDLVPTDKSSIRVRLTEAKEAVADTVARWRAMSAPLLTAGHWAQMLASGALPGAIATSIPS